MKLPTGTRRLTALFCLINLASPVVAGQAVKNVPAKKPLDKARSGPAFKVKSLPVKRDDTSDLLQTYFWRFELTAPEVPQQNKWYMFTLEVQEFDGTKTTNRPIHDHSFSPRTNGWPANGRITILFGTHPDNDNIASADQLKFIFRVEPFAMHR
jgi:uncharacterized protein Usg